MKTDQFPEYGETFFETLAGREQGLPGTEVLREAEGASTEELSADERAKMDALKHRLVFSGVLPTTTRSTRPVILPLPVSGKSTSSTSNDLLTGLGGLVFGGNLQRLVAIAASLLLVSLVAIKVGMPSKPTVKDVMRGDSVLLIFTDDAGLTVVELEKKLVPVGSDVFRVQINDAEWVLEVNIPKLEQHTQVKHVLRDAGYLIDKGPPFQLGVRQRKYPQARNLGTNLPYQSGDQSS